ncbi:hypothetical protein G9A89_018643 [Geosiphon pyriformis]|nr:hypothetical protein G9A89_018643 [Geosiphon pyriformis]
MFCDKLLLAASGSFFSPLAGSFSSVKVPSKRHTWLVFPALTTLTTTSTITALQIVTKVKNSKKQQHTVTTAMVTPNPFVVSDEILGKISTAAASPLSDKDGNSSSISPKIVLFSKLLPIPVAKQSINPDDLKDWADQMEVELTVPPPVSGAADDGVWKNVNGH